MFNVLTIAREYGSGGSDIGRKVAELLGWECVDKQIIERVAAMGKVNPAWAAQADEVIARYRPGTPTMASLLRLKALMEARGVVFPVETAEQWRARNGVK